MKKLMISLLLLLVYQPAAAERIKDLASVAGVRSNQLVGYGIVTGLTKTGDNTSKFIPQGLVSMMGHLGLTLPTGTDPKTKNSAFVSVHADLPPFAKPGQKIDVTVSSIGDAKSLRGGSLLMSPLRGADGKVYAVAQGNLVVNGLSATAQDGSKVTVNSPLVGRIPGGATVEQSVPTSFDQPGDLVFNLNTNDFSTANNIAGAINKTLGAGAAKALDGGSVVVTSPNEVSQRVSFVSVIENIEVTPDAAPAKVIVNSRTGTVIINNKVRIQQAAVSHGSLTVTISENPQVSQPNAFSNGTTAVTPQSDISVKEDKNRMFLFNAGVSLNEIVDAINAVGAGPSDIVAILEALKSAGAMQAELIVI
ncbi:MAG: flagellar basal body P-ring protein FlgI [Methylomonas sp.]|jgi:flagellar P-ring protein precursor FlgI